MAGLCVLVVGLAITIMGRWRDGWLLIALGLIWTLVGLLLLLPTLWTHLVAFAAFLESVRYQ